MGLTLQPPLKAGDLLLCAETTLHGVRPWKGKGSQRLLAYGYIGKSARQSIDADATDEKESPPDWMAELTSVQRAVMQGQNFYHAYPPPSGEIGWGDVLD